MTRFLDKSFPSKPANGKYRDGWDRVWNGDKDQQYICFECDRRWRGPATDDVALCPADDCSGYGEPLS